MSTGPYGPHEGYGGPPVPPMPPAPPPRPASPPPAPPDARRAAAVALLNLSGLGLGYVLLRRRLPAAACWAATAVLLFVALPADADGVPAAALAGYAVVLLAAAVHGGLVGLRTPLARPGRAPLALLLGLLLLAVPAGGALWYRHAHEEAVEQALLGRLQRADDLVAESGRRSFGSATPDYRRALEVYRDIAVHHSGSRAARRLPGSLRTYYTTVGAAYGHGRYCDAVEPLTYLRTVPDTMPREQLGSLAGWPDGRLADALYGCGEQHLAAGEADWVSRFGDLLDTFPRSGAAAKVAPAVDAAVRKQEKAVGGDDPCAAVGRLHDLDTRIAELAGAGRDTDGRLASTASRAGRSGDSGTYACGVDQYRDGDFASAQKTMEQFAAGHRHDPNRARAQKVAIAAEVARTLPAAGRKLPTTASGGSISVTVKNDSPDDITVLYTGPVTGSFTLKGCGGCKAYTWAETVFKSFKPCHDSSRHYPQHTISLPVGTTYFVHKPNGGSTATPASDTARLRSGYIYTECAYSTQRLGSGF
ncbi:hypothetical protein GCM10018980_50540 [Streptomyces capoamus]|uniref:Uncharacterized protein n=2 Tax=Streptomyces capoamus TaxID=68183 RepID=A0A919KDZ7_9ACTN|nr:hypothetical protein GCM10010501_30280 [Streptomyces libani subsp. rufus]GHG61455.1 hypothetical protein GCM10018980_50540 [Streptomyces capoamus]